MIGKLLGGGCGWVGSVKNVLYIQLHAIIITNDEIIISIIKISFLLAIDLIKLNIIKIVNIRIITIMVNLIQFKIQKYGLLREGSYGYHNIF